MRLKVIHALLVVGSTIVLFGTWNGSACAEGLITNLKLTSDLRRLIIMYEGRIGDPEIRTLANPSRIVVDLPDGRLGSIDRKRQFANKQLRELRTGQHERGARIVLDFGNYTAPQYKLRTLGNYVVVFLSEAGPPVHPLQARIRESRDIGRFQMRTKTEPRIKPRHVRKKPRARKPLSQVSQDQNDRFPQTSSPLFIKSAKVVNGMLLINVARKGKSAKEYRINLDVDWKRLGFKSADIHSVRKRASGEDKLAEAESITREEKLQSHVWKYPRKHHLPHGKSVRLKTLPHGPTRVSAKGNSSGPPPVNCVAKPCGFAPNPNE